MDHIREAFQSAFKACDHSAARHQPMTLKSTLMQLADGVSEQETFDVYGTGTLIEDFEKDIARRLGKEKAVFLPSGTLAQPIALKVWSDERRTPYVAMPPTSHLQLHEQNGYQALYGLTGVMLGQAHLVPSLADLQQAAASPLAAVLLELPMREIGGQLPSWDDLVAQTTWLKQHNIRTHMDGARLWQCPAHFGKSLAEICALFDSVYVSFYKDLGGISGACLAGDASFIEQAKVWIRRAGGNLYSLAPYIIAARSGLKEHLPEIPTRREQAQWLAKRLNRIQDVQTWPHEPQVNMFRVRVNKKSDILLLLLTTWMETRNVSVLTPPYQVGEQDFLCEISIGNAFGNLPLAQWEEELASLKSTIESGRL